MTYTILVNGAYGKMGTISVTTLQQHPSCQQVICAGRKDNLSDLILQHQPDIVLDFTLPDCVFEHAKKTLEHNTKLIVGTSGLQPEQIQQLQTLASKQHCGAIIAPNFSLSALLMIRYAAAAAPYFPQCEIIETHHPQKVDAPSATALRSAQAICNSRLHSKQHKNENKPQLKQAEKSTQQQYADTDLKRPAARGDTSCEVPIHSLRLGASFAEQQIIFAGHDEQLTISQRASSRAAMMPGLLLACDKVLQLDHLVYGLEHLISD